MELKEYFAYTNQGPYLQINEDTTYVDLVDNLFLLLDGFGGSNIGDKAVIKIKNDIKSFYSKKGNDPDATFPFSFSHKYLIEGNVLINSIHYAHERITKENEQKSLSERAGASCLAVAGAENILTFVSAGNCLAYLYRKGRLSLICPPDDLRLVAGDSYDDHFHLAPTSGLGLFEDIHLNVHEIKVLPNDLFIMLSDGAVSRVVENEIKFIFQRPSVTCREKIRELLDLNNTRGNLDNQSAIVLQF